MDEFERRVNEIKEAINLDMLARMERGDIPDCFSLDRHGATALAGMLMEALRQNQAMAGRLRALRQQAGDKTH